MTDTLALEYAIKKSGKTLKSVAEVLGISYSALWSKMHNETEFKASEISKISAFCCIDMESKERLFFAQKGEK